MSNVYTTWPRNQSRSKWSMAVEKEGHFISVERDASYSNSIAPSVFYTSTPAEKSWQGETTIEDFLESSRRSRLSRSRPTSRANGFEKKKESSERVSHEMPTYFASNEGNPQIFNRERDSKDVFDDQGLNQDEQHLDESFQESDFKKMPERAMIEGFTSDEKYLIGTLRVPLAKLEAVLARFPPPENWKALPSPERIAYVFHCALWSQYPLDFDAWHNRFNVEFYNLRLERLSNEDGLYEICARMQSHYMEEKEKRFKEEGHLYGGVPEHVRRGKSEPVKKSFGPLKHSGAVTFTRFAPDGRLIIVDSNKKNGFVALCRPTLLYRPKELEMLRFIQSFKSPLNAVTTTPRSIAAFVRRRIDQLRACRWEESLNDLILLWQLLLLSLQHPGNVSGPDIAALLIQSIDAEGGLSPVLTEFNTEQASSQPFHRGVTIEPQEVEELSAQEATQHSPLPKEEICRSRQAESSTIDDGMSPTTPILLSHISQQMDETGRSPTTVKKFSEHAPKTPTFDEYISPTTVTENQPVPRKDEVEDMRVTEKQPAERGLFKRLRDKISKALPNGAPEMRLPDDREKTIVWDPKLGRYVGAKTEDEVKTRPPPLMISNSPATSKSIKNRTSVASRYRTVGMESVRPPENSAPSLGHFSVGPNEHPRGLFIPSAPSAELEDDISPFTLYISPNGGASNDLHQEHAE